jgi:ferric-dicitrate binding protein FerR (iron transport regulator)
LESSPTAPLRQHEEEAIRHLLALENGASEAERQAAERWIAASPEHAVAFARARQAWRAAALLDAEPEVPARIWIPDSSVRAAGVFCWVRQACWGWCWRRPGAGSCSIASC